jgi:ABC-type sugar transport system substrate-binding protein
MKRFFALAAFALVVFPGAGASAASTAAMPACTAGDPVVWVNTKSKVYHMQGDPYYGNTKAGKYACKSAADAAGDHAPKGAAAPSGKKSKHHPATPDPAAT